MMERFEGAGRAGGAKKTRDARDPGYIQGGSRLVGIDASIPGREKPDARKSGPALTVELKPPRAGPRRADAAALAKARVRLAPR